MSANAFSQQLYIKLKGAIDSFFITNYATTELVIRKVVTANIQGKEELIRIPIMKGGFFNVQLPVDDSLSYLAFAFEDKKPGNKAGLLKNTYGGLSQPPLKEVYLFQAGDSVSVVLKPTVRPYFWGKGSEKLNCASQLYQIEAIHPGLETRAGGMQDRTASLAFRMDALDFTIQMRLKLIQSYQHNLSPFVYQLLRADAIHSAVYEALSPVINNPNFSLTTFMYPKNVILDAYTKAQKYVQQDIDPVVMERSAYGADFIVRNEMIKRLLDRPDVTDRNEFTSGTYQYFKSNYSGKLRDKILLIFFETMGRHFSTEVKSLVADALSWMEPGKHARTLNTWKETQYYAFPFKLYDAKQKMHTLADYKGKLVIMDFYFSKCGPCIQLAKAMKPIFHQYKNRNDIVFITVSTDPKEIFLKTLATKVFTDDGMVNLYTNGRGMSDPLIQQYDFKGFPRMLIIGKDGTLISSSPPRADISLENRKAFIILIEKNLVK